MKITAGLGSIDEYFDSQKLAQTNFSAVTSLIPGQKNMAQ